jgi:hypothetical protein
MTFERKCLTEPSDIIAIHYECRNCHASSVIPIGQIQVDSQQLIFMAMGACKYCQTSWGFTINTREMAAFVDFNILVKQIAEIMAGRNLRLRLEIACPE